MRDVSGISLNELIDLVDRLIVMKGVALISPTETMATCSQFYYDCYDLAIRLDRMSVTGDGLRRIARRMLNDCAEWHESASAAENRKDWDRGAVNAVRIARWERGPHWVELCRGRFDYSYTSNNACGSVCSPFATNEAAVTVMISMMDRGCFLPDNAVLPMKRVV